MITPEFLAAKRHLFDEMLSSVRTLLSPAAAECANSVSQSHDGTIPYKISAPVPPIRRGYDVDPAWLVKPVPAQRPVLDERARKYAGLDPYPGLEELYAKAEGLSVAQPEEDRDRTDFFD